MAKKIVTAATKTTESKEKKNEGYFVGYDFEMATSCGFDNPDGRSLKECLDVFHRYVVEGDFNSGDIVEVYKITLIGKYKADVVTTVTEVSE